MDKKMFAILRSKNVSISYSPDSGSCEEAAVPLKIYNMNM